MKRDKKLEKQIDQQLKLLHIPKEYEPLIKQASIALWESYMSIANDKVFVSIMLDAIRDMRKVKLYPNETPMGPTFTLGDLRAVTGWMHSKRIIVELAQIQAARSFRFLVLNSGADPEDQITLHILFTLDLAIQDQIIRCVPVVLKATSKLYMKEKLDVVAEKKFLDQYELNVVKEISTIMFEQFGNDGPRTIN